LGQERFNLCLRLKHICSAAGEHQQIIGIAPVAARSRGGTSLVETVQVKVCNNGRQDVAGRQSLGSRKHSIKVREADGWISSSEDQFAEPLVSDRLAELFFYNRAVYAFEEIVNVSFQCPMQAVPDRATYPEDGLLRGSASTIATIVVRKMWIDAREEFAGYRTLNYLVRHG
jgi:hypothetical protein